MGTRIYPHRLSSHSVLDDPNFRVVIYLLSTGIAVIRRTTLLKSRGVR